MGLHNEKATTPETHSYSRGAKHTPRGVESNATMTKRRPPTTSSEPADPPPKSWEEATEALEALVRRMESGSLSLEESIKAYREGVALVQWSRETLASAQQQVRVLEEDMLKPYSPEADGS
ncbi:MAG: Exonuclease small subunit [Pseudomonadota bacterium]|mgnify:CR=1 FL=1